jgi:hypothetical protein
MRPLSGVIGSLVLIAGIVLSGFDAASVQAENADCRSEVARHAQKRGIKMDENSFRRAIGICHRGNLERAKQFLDSVDTHAQPSAPKSFKYRHRSAED